MNADSCLTQVYRLTWNEAEGFSVQQLPALPETIDNASATRAGNNIYVTGGNQQYGQNNNKPRKLWLRNSFSSPPYYI
jgi:N-acetylneuraminic acid mutarotase